MGVGYCASTRFGDLVDALYFTCRVVVVWAAAMRTWSRYKGGAPDGYECDRYCQAFNYVLEGTDTDKAKEKMRITNEIQADETFGKFVLFMYPGGNFYKYTLLVRGGKKAPRKNPVSAKAIEDSGTKTRMIGYAFWPVQLC